MIQPFVAVALFAQLLSPLRAYTTGAPGWLELATPDGRYVVQLGEGCETITSGLNVDLLPGSGNVAAIAPLDSDIVCNLLITQRLSDEPCATLNDVCDVGAD